MHPAKTYELRISFVAADTRPLVDVKEDVKAWLIGIGEESFVEGVVDGIYIDQDFDNPERDFYGELGGDDAPISVFRYDAEHLESVRVKLEATFKGAVQCSMHAHDTQEWQEGWKENFKPFVSHGFFIYPPWEKQQPLPAGTVPLLIEPGMAFGTGLHATTQLCLAALREVSAQKSDLATGKVLDVGTGTAILAIAAKKLGWGRVYGTDIDPDAVKAASENARDNQVAIEVQAGSLPEVWRGIGFDLIFANILGVILRKMIPELAPFVAAGGHLIISGILNEEEAEMTRLAASVGLSCQRAFQQDDWSAVVFRKG